MYSIWPVQEAKNGFCHLLDEAVADNPQIVTRHGRPIAVLVSYERFMKGEEPKESMGAFFRRSPLVGSGIDLERNRETGRTIDL